ncbi:hypothetical protein CGMCC3_g15875 [Colletotrichum fructicola]|uniref:Uncharacterized protein n=1 Tax=Colletotrichum fructicola (strain Nara gc5) TaxID=1213859 RepID=A0A7J6IE14_COLFN|nr:uncharacterized protein CGMCC3_g15875 [Colletotrichum fructicola]KAE9568027.1 hypothetical protein CGMCC3_g15875 [Colletotrichum fructicola]KAF4418790.1 hypothetical protein CFRS1_v014924 [Colletotrichum fructicola]KAF4474482.1 hypothetical protein CGGC5_v016979 [Colletotrichum fructicola Nara gc5]
MSNVHTEAMAVVDFCEPRVFTRTHQETFQHNTPIHPYLTFTLGSGGLKRLVVKIWSHDQGWCDDRLKTQDHTAHPSGQSYTLADSDV